MIEHPSRRALLRAIGLVALERAISTLERMKSAEIGPKTPWQQGLKKLRDLTLKDAPKMEEYGQVYVNSGKIQQWNQILSKGEDGGG